MRNLLRVVVSSLLASSAVAQTHQASIDTKKSTADLHADTVLTTSGYLIGDYDAKSNPGGTQTRPGLSGGSGNMPVPVDVDFNSDTEIQTTPAGTFEIDIDFQALTLSLDQLLLDLLNGQEGENILSVTLLSGWFRTFNPTMLYPGGTPITVPIGQIGTLSRAEIVQTNEGNGVLTQTDDPDVYSFSALVPVDFSLTVSFALPGTEPVEMPLELPLALPLTGQVEVLSGGNIRITITVEQQTSEVDLPVDGFELPGIPVPLPTISGEYANVILYLTTESLTLTTTFGLNLSAIGEQVNCQADFNGDGVLDFFDVSGFLAAFSAGMPEADLNNDGIHDFFDVQIFLGLYSAGCGTS